MHFDAEFFVAAGFAVFLMLLGYLGVHRKLTAGLDARIKKVEDELADARRLRAEAEAVLASFKKKAADAEAEAASIVTLAKAEADNIAKETAARMAEFVERRGKQAEAKIAMAEAQVTAEVRAAAADAAIKAAETVIRAHTTGAVASNLVGAGIQDLKRLMN